MKLSSPAAPATSAASSPRSCSRPGTRSPSSTTSRAATAAAVPAGAELVEVDLLDAAATPRRSAGGFDGVLHFAALALVAESVAHPERYWRGNVVGTLNLLDAMRAHGVQRLVFSSTCATYGEPERSRSREDEPTAPGQRLRRTPSSRSTG